MAPPVLKRVLRRRWSAACAGPKRCNALVSCGRCGHSSAIHPMKGKKAAVIGDEPIGIVISRGADREKPPVFSAYVWAPAPDKKPDEAAETRVA